MIGSFVEELLTLRLIPRSAGSLSTPAPPKVIINGNSPESMPSPYVQTCYTALPSLPNNLLLHVYNEQVSEFYPNERSRRSAGQLDDKLAEVHVKELSFVVFFLLS